MHTFIKKLKEIYHSAYFPFILFFIAIVILHMRIVNINGDDVYFSNILQESHQNIWEYLQMRYMTWSSRLLIEGTMVSLLKFQLLFWKIINIGMYLLLAMSISKLVNTKKSRILNYMICALILMIPINLINETGWVATTMNYLWVVALGLYALTTLRKKTDGEKIAWWEYPVYVLITLYACNQEQMAVVILAVLSVFLLYQCVTKKIKYVLQHNRFLMVQWIIAVGSLLFILTCPGNKERTVAEVATWYPEYANFNMLEKVELGLTTMMKPLVLHINGLCILLTGAIWLVTCKKRKELIYKCIAAIPLLGCTIFTVFKEQVVLILPKLGEWIAMFEQNMLIMPLSQISWDKVLFLLFYIVFLCSIPIGLYLAFGRTKKGAIAIGIYLLAVATKMVMGFSPTVFASGNRTSLCLYVSFIIEIIMLAQEVKFCEKEGVKNEK